MKERLNYDYDSSMIEYDYFCSWLERLTDYIMDILRQHAKITAKAAWIAGMEWGIAVDPCDSRALWQIEAEGMSFDEWYEEFNK